MPVTGCAVFTVDVSDPELDLESLRPPADPRGRALNALLEERREGR